MAREGATGEEGAGLDAGGRRFCLVVSRFNREVTASLAEGARRALSERGADPGAVDVVEVPGAWELPWAVRRACRGGYDAVVALGCVIRGETPHFEYICRGATRGLMDVASEGGTPVTFGLLTCDDADQARARAGGAEGNKGAEAALAALELVALEETALP